MYKKSSLVCFCLFMSYILYIVGACNSCTNETEKCEIPKNNTNYKMNATLENGPADLCGDMNPFTDPKMPWMTVTETMEMANCTYEPDEISKDKCTVKSYYNCVTGLAVDMVTEYKAKDEYSGTFTLWDNNIYSCQWSFEMRK